MYGISRRPAMRSADRNEIIVSKIAAQRAKTSIRGCLGFLSLKNRNDQTILSPGWRKNRTI